MEVKYDGDENTHALNWCIEHITPKPIGTLIWSWKGYIFTKNGLDGVFTVR